MGFWERHRKFFLWLGILLVTIPGVAASWSGLFIKEPLIPYLIEKAGGVDVSNNMILIALPFVLMAIGLILLFLLWRASRNKKLKEGVMVEKNGSNIYKDESVTSHNQQGGQTARNIINVGTQPRTLKNINTPSIIGKISQYSGTKVDVTAIMGDAEAGKFAQEIKVLLDSAGWITGEVNNAVYLPMPSGIVVQSPQDSVPKALLVLGQSLKNAGLKVEAQYNCNIRGLQVLIGAN